MHKKLTQLIHLKNICILKMLNIFQKFVTEQNYSYLKLEGTTSIGSRQPIINKFNTVILIVYFMFL